MGIMTRMIRLCKADIHGVMDQIEDKGLLLKQLLRDMEEELGKKEAELQNMAASREHARQTYEKRAREMEKLEHDIMSAVEKNKDDIAKMLIKKQKRLAIHQEEMAHHIESMNREISRFQESVKSRQLHYEKLKIRAAEYFHGQERKEWEKNITCIFPVSPAAEPSDEEIELELIKRREALKGGGSI